MDIKNIVKGHANNILRVNPLVEALAKHRYEVCKSCEGLTNKGAIIEICDCGCPIEPKIRGGNTCPRKKWKK